MTKFKSVGLEIPEVKLISRYKYADERGWLDKIYSSEVLSDFGWNTDIKQINHTLTKKMGTIRGMHYQYSPKAEMKIVTCLRGVIFDVVVDLRSQSDNFLKWVSVELSADSGISLFIPKGFAHGFQAMSNDVELLYLHSAEYDQINEGCLNPFDERLKISWPLNVSEISSKDLNCKRIDSDFYGVSI